VRSVAIRIIAVLAQVILFSVALNLVSRAIDDAIEKYRRRHRRRPMFEFLPCLELPFPEIGAT
jgi:hypothetical protein